MPHLRAALRRAPVLAGALALCAARTAAQAPSALPDSGAVLRLDAPGLELSGRAVRLDARWGDTLVVLDPKGAGRTGVPLAMVRRVDVRVREGRGSAARGARVGFVVGAVPSAVFVGIVGYSERDCDYLCLATPLAAAAGVLVTGLTTGLGALIGRNQQENQWAPVWAPTRTSLRAVPVVTERGVGLAFGGRF
jgi:hypothetical protein